MNDEQRPFDDASPNDLHSSDARHQADWAEIAPVVIGTPDNGSQPPQVTGFPKLRFGLWLIAWPVVLGLVAFVVATPYLMSEAMEEEQETAGPSGAQLMTLELTAKYLVGMTQFGTLTEAQKQDLLTQASSLNAGPWTNRLASAILLGELAGPEKALEQLEEIQQEAEEQQYEPNEWQRTLHQNLETVYEDYEQQDWTASSLGESDREQLTEQLGWLGKLALTPAEGPQEEARGELLQTATMTLFLVLGAFLGALLLGVAGLALFVLFCVQAFRRGLRWRTPPRTRNGLIYIETFAVWFLMFLGFSVLGGALVSEDGGQAGMLLINGVAFLASLSALAWPLVRGISWAELRHDIGLRSDQPVAEIGWAFVCYLATLPLVGIGFAVMIVMMGISSAFNPTEPFQQPDAPSHPIGEWIATAGWEGILLIYFLAAVCAPIVEETMFRGVLYRHFRDITAKQRMWLSVGLSAFLNSLLFAAIHPQGVFGIPVLVALAVGFSLTREWRNSLYTPMAMHAMHNGMVTTIAVFLL